MPSKTDAGYHTPIMRLFLFILLCLVPLTFLPAHATEDAKAQIDQAVKIYNSGNYPTAFGLFHSLAKEGNPKAQHNLGVMYDKGQGVPQDYTEAIKWYRKAGEQGLVEAQYNLGVMYYEGQGVPQDYTEAIKWHRKAGEQGYPWSQFNLGVMYRDSQGVPQDFVEAYAWFTLAAEQGDEKAIYGKDFATSKLSPQDLVRAQELSKVYRQKYAP